MKSFLIIYQLSFPETSYNNLIGYLKSATYWARPCTTTWIIKTTVDVAKIRDGIKERATVNDHVVVIELPLNTNWASFGISKKVTDWMKGNI